MGLVRPRVRPRVRPHFRPRVRKLRRPRGGRVPAACRSQVWPRPAARPDTCAGHVSGHTSRFFRAGAPAGREVSRFDSPRRRFPPSACLDGFLLAGKYCICRVCLCTRVTQNRPSVCVSVCPFVGRCVCLSMRLSVGVSVCLSDCLVSILVRMYVSK